MAGFRRRFCWLKGLEGTLAISWDIGAEQRWSREETWWGWGASGANGCRAWGGWQQGFPIIARMSEHACWGRLRGPHEEAGPQAAPDPPPTDPPLSPLLSPQGVISAAKELDYEISHGRYTLIVTATDQCPILSHRLTSTTTVGGWDIASTRGRTGPRKIVQEKHLNPRALSWPWQPIQA